MKKMNNILKTEIPISSLMNTYFQRIDFRDCYSMNINKEIILNDVARCFFTTAPAWVVKMMQLRDSIVKMLGLKTNHSNPESKSDPRTSSYQVGEKFGLFQILERTEQELIMGSDDKHLNFRVSIFIENDAEYGRKISISTIAAMHNAFGRIYMKLVAPFHKIVVPGMMINIFIGLNKSHTPGDIKGF